MRTRSFEGLVAAVLLLGCSGGGNDAKMGGGGGDGGVGDGPVPARIEVQVTPPRAAYRTDQDILVEATVWDGDDAPIDEAPVSWSVDPAEAVEAGDEPGAYRLLREGFVTIEGCSPHLDGHEICDSVPIFVDAGAPNLEVHAPTPGAQLGADGESQIEVRGSVADARDVTVFVNGMPVEWDEMGMFHASVRPLFGVNHLEVVAVEGVSPESTVRMDVAWAPQYLPALAADGKTPYASFSEGMTLQLGQPFFDDGRPLDGSEDAPRADDLADVLALVLQRTDYAALLPDPVIDEAPTLVLRITDVRTEDIDVSVDVVEGGMDVFARVGRLAFDTEGHLEVDDATLSLDGGIDAVLSAFAGVDARKPGAESDLVTGIRESHVAVESLSGRFDDPEANAILRLAEGRLRSLIEEMIGDVMDDTLASALPAIVVNAVTALDRAFMGRRIELDAEPFTPVTIEIDGGLVSLDTAYRRWLRGPLRFSVGTDGTAIHPDSPGVADLEGASSPPLFASRPLQLSVRLAVLNALLHSLWNDGLLEIDATSALPDSVSSIVDEAVLSARMPPVLRPARGDESGDLILSLGQAELDLTVGDRTRFGVSLRAETDVTLVDGTLSVDLAEDPELRVWTIQSEASRPLVDEGTVRSLLHDTVWPRLRDAIGEAVAIDAPVFALGELSELAPSLADFALRFELGEGVDARQNHVVLDLQVVGSGD